jgi:hypothetical protein
MDLDHKFTVGIMFCCFCSVLLYFRYCCALPSSADVMNEGAITLFPLYDFIAQIGTILPFICCY